MLTTLQRREAQRLQLHGKTLREIARSIGATYEQVCLSLFGGIHDWEPRIGTPVSLEGITYTIHTTDGAPASPALIEALQPVVAAAAEAMKEHNDGSSEADDGTGGAGGDGDGNDRVSELLVGRTAAAPAVPGTAAVERGDARPDQPDRAPAPAQPAGAQKPAEEPAGGQGKEAVAPAASTPDVLAAPPRYRLTNELGEYLDKSGVGITRHREKAWVGTAQQMEVIFKSRRHLQNLDPERVLP